MRRRGWPVAESDTVRRLSSNPTAAALVPKLGSFVLGGANLLGGPCVLEAVVGRTGCSATLAMVGCHPPKAVCSFLRGANRGRGCELLCRMSCRMSGTELLFLMFGFEALRKLSYALELGIGMGGALCRPRGRTVRQLDE